MIDAIPDEPMITADTDSPSTTAGRTLQAGVATCDITPSGAVRMSGFAARTGLSAGIHDNLTVRALVVGRTAILTVDVVGLHEDFCTRVKRAVSQWADHLILHATHTHSGPGSMPGRLGGTVDRQWLEHVESICADSIEKAASSAGPARILAGYGEDSDVGRNRRRPNGPIDRAVPVVRVERSNGSPLAILVSYACHPVVLSAENNLLSADYPGVVRERLEAETGATALFATSCAGDVNTGHTVNGELSNLDSEPRTFTQCNLVGERIANAALKTHLEPARQITGAACGSVNLRLDAPSPVDLQREASQQAEAKNTASKIEWKASVTVLSWGPAVIVALPGEPFSRASVEIRRRVTLLTGAKAVLVLGYSDGCPGYFPTCNEYSLGGYEVEQAHFYYGMPGAFAQGSLELLVEEAVRLTQELPTIDRNT